jgi:NitT/TauT family transport system substrate-binding protein
MQIVQSRRGFLASLSSAGAAGIVGFPQPLHAEPPPETTTVRLPKWPEAVCDAPTYVAGELLRAEGFTDVRYPEFAADASASALFADDEIDFASDFPPNHIVSVEAGVPIKVLTGLHSGCLELIANDNIHRVLDLRGKRVGVPFLNSPAHWWLTLMAAYVGIDPGSEIQWVTDAETSALDLFARGEIDAFLGLPPEPQALRARNIGHTILKTSVDRPWSQYFCCMLSGRADYVNRYPVATKRVVRAILKAADLCVSKPDLAARLMVDRGFTDRYDFALEAISEARYDRWSDFDPEDTIRFFALRMHEADMIASDPNTIIDEGTDWRFHDEVKRELKT